MTGSNVQNTPATILVHDLLVDILCLSRPRSAIPACTQMTRAFRGPQLYRSWAHHLIFHSNHLAEAENKSECIETRLFDFDPAARQPVSRLSVYLKSRLPNFSDHLAPTCRQDAAALSEQDDILTAPYVDWLFSPHGPFRTDLMRHNPSPWQAQLDTLCGPLYPEDGDDYPFSHPDRLKLLLHRRWQIVPDAFQLAIYFARSGHIELFQHSLSHLHNLLPDLASSALPMSRWFQLTLDNRASVRPALNLVIDMNVDARLTLPVFMCLVGALDWSLPAIHSVASVFPSAMTQFTACINTYDGVFCAIFDTLSAVKDPERAVRLLDWMYTNGLNKQHVDVDDTDSDSPFFASSAGNARVFGALLTRFDVPRALPVFSAPASGDDADAEPRRIYCERLGESIEWWALCASDGGDHWGLVDVGLQHGLFGKRVLAKLLLKAASDGDEARQASIVQHVKQSQATDLRAVVYTALTLDPDAAPSPAVCGALRSLLHDPVDERTQYLLANLHGWSDKTLATLVFDAEPPFSSADHARFVTAWLHKIMDKHIGVGVTICQSAVLARVFLLALPEINVTDLPIEALALGAGLCVLVMGGASGESDFSERQSAMLKVIAKRCREAMETKQVACRVSRDGVRYLKPVTVELLKTTGEVLDRFWRGVKEEEVSVKRLLFDFSLALGALDENELVGT